MGDPPMFQGPAARLRVQPCAQAVAPMRGVLALEAGRRARMSPEEGTWWSCVEHDRIAVAIPVGAILCHTDWAYFLGLPRSNALYRLRTASGLRTIPASAKVALRTSSKGGT